MTVFLLLNGKAALAPGSPGAISMTGSRRDTAALCPRPPRVDDPVRDRAGWASALPGAGLDRGPEAALRGAGRLARPLQSDPARHGSLDRHGHPGSRRLRLDGERRGEEADGQ